MKDKNKHIYIEDNIDKIIDRAPAEEPGRQLYFIEQCRTVISRISDARLRPLTSCVVTFGCQMNERDSEKLNGVLREIGFIDAGDENADFVLYNTCTVRENANVRFLGRLGALKSFKKKNPSMIVAVCGCMMQEKNVAERIKEQFGHVDIIFGTHNIYKLAELLFMQLISGNTQVEVLKTPPGAVENLPTERKYPFKCGVNIMYGCDNYCSYCIVPFVRGRERSRRPEDIIAEIEALASDGVIEVMLLGQNVNSYGKKFIDGSTCDINFPGLLRMAEQVDGIERIRFMTSHPKDLSDELIDTIACSKKICRHIHLPLQSGSDSILSKMNRVYTKASYLNTVSKIRSRIPDASITTDIIVGFPGESEADFEDTLDVVRQAEYESAFTFIYSKRTGTRAALMPNQVPAEVSAARMKKLLAVISETAKSRTERFTGTIQKALAEEPDRKYDGLITGRLSNNYIVHFKGDKSLIGQIVNVRLDEAKGFYYNGTLTDDVSLSGDKKTV